MKVVKLALGGLLVLSSLTVWADAHIAVCFNYGCSAQADVVYTDKQLRRVGRALAAAKNADAERDAISVTIGRLLKWAGEQTPIAVDKGGNMADDEVSGKMDCIDHSTTTTLLLQMLEERHWIRYHHTLGPVVRRHFVFFEHHSAQIEEVSPVSTGEDSRHFVVDSWFVDNGQPAVVMPLANWLAGEGPDVGN
jgi:hypothetical protein